MNIQRLRTKAAVAGYLVLGTLIPPYLAQGAELIPNPSIQLPAVTNVVITATSVTVERVGTNIPVSSIGEPVGGVTLSAPEWIAANGNALNEEAIRNLGYLQMKKTHDAVMVILQRVYGEKPRFNYYIGTSQGGREALTVAQRYPAAAPTE